MSNDLKVMDISRIGEWSSSRTGKYQITGLQALDDALAARISAMYTNAVSDDSAPLGGRYSAFLAKKPEERVYNGKFDDVTTTLRAIAKADAGQKSVIDTTPLNGLALPVVNVSRAFNLSYENADEGKAIWDHAAWKDSSGMPLADLYTQYVNITYDVTLIAAEKETLALMCNALAASLYILEEHKLTHTGRLFGGDVPMQSAINTPKLVAFTDITPTSSGRIFAASTTLSVTAQVCSAWELDTSRLVTNVDISLKE